MTEDRIEGKETVDLDGWTRRTTIDEPRLSELAELYRELGFEVMLRAVSKAELGDQCAECMMVDPDRYKTIYTRRRPGREVEEEAD